MKVKDKVIAVTGGGNGIGRELVLQLLAKGARVAAVDLSEKALNETLKLSGESKSKLSVHLLDITDRLAVEALPKDIIKIHLGSINQYHSELKNWYSRFKGVSTKHLEGYLVWFRFMKLLQYQTEYENRSIELMNYTISNKVSIKNQDICRKPFPIDIFKPYQHLS